jgi:membrane-bound serine protease (ClpP class)
MTPRPFLLFIFSIIFLGMGGTGSTQIPGSTTQEGERAIIVRVHGEIDVRMVALVRRAWRKSVSSGYSRLILDIDTPGGAKARMDEILTILKNLREKGVDTVAYIRNQGLSAGAIIALGCKRVFMKSGSTIGAATPVFFGGMLNQVEKEVRKKYISAVRAQVRTLASHHGDRVALLAEAMVDPTLELHELRYRGKDGVTRSRLMTLDQMKSMRSGDYEVLEDHILDPKPLTLTSSEALRLGLSEGIVEDLEGLLRELGIGPGDSEILEPNWSEELASFLFRIRFLLLVAGFFMIMVSVKVPGTGLPEAMAVLCFLFFFGGNWLVGLAAWTEILLFAVGIGLVLVELFFVPGTLIAGLGGLIAIMVALFLSLQPFGLPANPWEKEYLTRNLWGLLLSILGGVGLLMLASRLLPKIPLFSSILLDPKRPLEVYSNAATQGQSNEQLLGKHGRALTDLRPAGKMDVEGEPIDVVTDGRFVEKGSDLEVVKVEGNRILVVPISESERGLISIPFLLFLLFLGFLAMVAEVFFPSFGVLSILSGILVVSTVFFSFEHGMGVGLTFLLGVLISAPIVLFFAFQIFPKTRIGKAFLLNGPSFDPKKALPRDQGILALVGKAGTTVTPLRPSGTVEIDGVRWDAMTRGEMLDEGSAVRVLRVEMSQLVVEPVQSNWKSSGSDKTQAETE